MTKEEKQRTITLGEIKVKKILVSEKYVYNLLNRGKRIGGKIEMPLKDIVNLI